MLVSTVLFAQEYKRNNMWALGYDPVVKFNFNAGINIDVVNNINTIPYCILSSSSSAISDTSGNLLFFSNGFFLYDSSGYAMENGLFINCPYGNILANYYGASLFNQTSIIIPKKGNTYYVFSTGMSDSVANNYLNHVWTEFDVLNYSVVDMDSNAGKGKVVQKNMVLADKQHYTNCAMQAVKHSNGKDWWLVKADCENNRYQEYLVKEDTILGPYYQNYSDTSSYCYWLGQLYFNNAGTMMACSNRGSKDYSNGTLNNVTNRVDLFDFDRCNGALIHKQTYYTPNDSTTPNTGIKCGICFSPIGKLLYMSNVFTVYQIDIEDTNQNNALLIHGPDTTLAEFPTYNTMACGANGKLYIGNFSGTRKYMSYIDSPNVKGLGCGFVPQGLSQPFNNNLLDPPNMPNFGLGADTSVICWPLQNSIVKENEKEWVIYPNPAYQNIYIKNARGKRKIVCNVSGQIISSTTKDEIDVSKYAKGMYFIQINNAVKKIIIE